ncbi:hypothetical protein BsWGS_17385 [Bradybaena similaris]
MARPSKSKRKSKSHSYRAGWSKSRSSRSGKKESRSSKAGLDFPVCRVDRMLKAGRYAGRVSSTSSVYMAAILELLAAEVLVLASCAAKESKTNKIIPRHLKEAIRGDRYLKKYLSGVTKADDLDGGLAAVPIRKTRKNNRRS